MEDELKYEIQVTEKQLMIIINAVERMSRFNSGQVGEVLEDIWWQSDRLNGDTREKMVRLLKTTIFPELSRNESYGVGEASNKLEQLVMEQYELYRQLQHKRVTLEPSEHYSVYNYQGLKYTDKPLPKVNLLKTPNQKD